MSDTVKLNVDVFKASLDKLSKGIEEFEPYSKKFIDEAISDIGICNSDFIVSYEKALTFTKDTKAPSLLNRLKNIESAATLLLEGYVDADTSLATATKKGGW